MPPASTPDPSPAHPPPPENRPPEKHTPSSPASAAGPRFTRFRLRRRDPALPRPAPGPAVRVAGRLARFAWIAVAVTSLPAFLGAHGWFLDLLAHFRVQYAAMALAAAVTALLLRRRLDAAAAGLLVVINGAVFAPAWLGSPPAPAGPPAVSVVLANLLSSNPEREAALQVLRSRQVDLLVALEVSPAWAAALETGLPDYPYRRVIPRSDNFGIALFSRRPGRFETVEFLPDGPPSIVLFLPAGADDLMVIGTHAVPPVGGDWTGLRNRHLAAVADAARRHGPQVVVVGDLNATPWSAGFAPLEAAGLVDTRRGFGLQTTWPAGFFPLRIPIDHCLVGAGLAARRRETFTLPGSDHDAVQVDLSWQHPR